MLLYTNLLGSFINEILKKQYKHRMAAPGSYDYTKSMIPAAGGTIHAMSGGGGISMFGGNLEGYNAGASMVPAVNPSIAPINEYRGGWMSDPIKIVGGEVNSPPNQQLKLEAFDIVINSFKVKWKDASEGVNYAATAQSVKDINKTSQIIADISANIATFNGLEADTEYNVVVKDGTTEIGKITVKTLNEPINDNSKNGGKDIILFGTSLTLEDPRTIVGDAFTESHMKALEQFGLDGPNVTNSEKRSILIALYDGKCNTEKPLVFLDKCEPIRRIVQTLALKLLESMETENGAGLNGVKKEDQPAVEFIKGTDGSMKVTLTFKSGQLGLLSKFTSKKIRKGPTGTSLGPTGTSLGPTGTSLGPTGTSLGPTGTSLDATGTSLGPTGTSLDATGTSLGATGTSLDPVYSTDLQDIDEDKFKDMGLTEQKELLEKTWGKANQSRFKDKYDRLKAIIDEEERDIKSAINVKYQQDIDEVIKIITKKKDKDRTEDEKKIISLYDEINRLKQTTSAAKDNYNKSTIEININKIMNELIELVKTKIKSRAFSTESEDIDITGLFPPAANENFVNSSNIQSLKPEKLDKMGLLEARMVLENAWKKADQSAFIENYNTLKRHLDTIESDLSGNELYYKQLGIPSDSTVETILAKFMELAPKLYDNKTLKTELTIAKDSILNKKFTNIDTKTNELKIKIEELYDKSYGNKDLDLPNIEQSIKDNKASEQTKEAYEKFVEIIQKIPKNLILIHNSKPNDKQTKIDELSSDITKAEEALNTLLEKSQEPVTNEDRYLDDINTVSIETNSYIESNKLADETYLLLFSGLDKDYDKFSEKVKDKYDELFIKAYKILPVEFVFDKIKMEHLKSSKAKEIYNDVLLLNRVKILDNATNEITPINKNELFTRMLSLTSHLKIKYQNQPLPDDIQQIYNNIFRKLSKADASKTKDILKEIGPINMDKFIIKTDIGIGGGQLKAKKFKQIKGGAQNKSKKQKTKTIKKQHKKQIKINAKSKSKTYKRVVTIKKRK
jgi:hypothetical protein